MFLLSVAIGDDVLLPAIPVTSRPGFLLSSPRFSQPNVRANPTQRVVHPVCRDRLAQALVRRGCGSWYPAPHGWGWPLLSM